MNKSIRGTTKKKRGRPPTTGRGTQIGMRWQDPELAAIDEWRQAHNIETRPEAIRRLVELGLTAKPKASVGKRTADSELAAEALASLTVGAPDTEEQSARRRRLGLRVKK